MFQNSQTGPARLLHCSPFGSTNCSEAFTSINTTLKEYSQPELTTPFSHCTQQNFNQQPHALLYFLVSPELKGGIM